MRCRWTSWCLSGCGRTRWACTGSTTTPASMMIRRSRWRWALITCSTLTGALRRGSGGRARKAIAAGAIVVDGQVMAVPEPPRRPGIAAGRPEAEPVLMGVVVDAAAARKAARDELYRATPGAIALRMMNGG